VVNKVSSSAKYRRNSRGWSWLNFGAVLCPRAGITCGGTAGGTAAIDCEVFVGGVEGVDGRFDGIVDGSAEVEIPDEVCDSVVLVVGRSDKEDEVAVSNSSRSFNGRRDGTGRKRLSISFSDRTELTSSSRSVRSLADRRRGVGLDEDCEGCDEGIFPKSNPRGGLQK
jgi:hypothetical protein